MFFANQNNFGLYVSLSIEKYKKANKKKIRNEIGGGNQNNNFVDLLYFSSQMKVGKKS